jgi:glycosyltransferase involved in cell wall biosynthesis
MKIALIADSIKSKTGGPSVILKETKIALQKKGIDVKIISNDDLKKTKVSLNNSMNGIDICHLYGGWTYFHVKCFFTARNLKKKIIIHPLGYYEPWSLKEKKFKKIIAWYGYQKKIIEAANLIHCASKQEEKNLLKLKVSFNTRVIPYGIKDSFIKKKITKKIIKKKGNLFFENT